MAASPTRIAADTRPPTTVTPPLLGVLALLAVGSALVLSLPTVAGSLDHERPITGTGGVVTLVLFLVAWTLMMLAMMLPSAATLLATVGRLTPSVPRARALQLTTSVAYLSIWLAIGYLFRAGDVVVHGLVEALPWVAANTAVVGGAVLLIAGGFQFSDLKRRCLTACRTPASFVYRHWHGGNPIADALRIGGAYGLSCVGCCWALMLVMFAFGVMNAAWMLAFGVLMAAEKTTRFGRALTAPLGVTLLALGAAVIVTECAWHTP